MKTVSFIQEKQAIIDFSQRVAVINDKKLKALKPKKITAS
jgi:hypothetical protein